jgi:hypothetical protein
LIVFLFGAGASYGAGHILPCPPPLGSGLYNELKNSFPITWGRLPPKIDKMFEIHFEDGMGYLWNKMESYVPDLLQSLAMFFAGFRLDGSKQDSYSKLFTRLINEMMINDVVFSTINYDCLIEFALSQCGRQIIYFGIPQTQDKTNAVLKLHGSCNFLPNRISATRGILIGSGIGIEGGIRVAADLSEVYNFCNSNTALHPSMAIYMKGKPVQTSPRIIEHLQNNWQKLILNATDVVTIGVNPWPDDKHIWDPLTKTSAKLLFIGNEQAFKDWCRNYRKKGESKYIGNRFNLHFPQVIENLLG